MYSFKKIDALILGFILFIVAACYSPALKNDFVLWDDEVHLLNNPAVLSLDFSSLKDIFTQTVNHIYIPLTTFSFAIEHHFFGFNPFIYHLDNLLLHLLATVLVFLLAQRLGLASAGAGIAALIFGLHPMRVESVAWVTERKDVLYAVFYLAALLSYIKFLNPSQYLTRHNSSKNENSTSRGYLILSFILGLLSMLAKPMALSLPLIFLLLDWFYRRGINKYVILEKIPLVGLVVAIGWLSYSAHARVPIENLFEAPLIWIWTFVFYIKKFFFLDYFIPLYYLPSPINTANVNYLVPLIVFGLFIFVLIKCKNSRWFIFAAGFYVLSIFFLLRFDDLKDINIVADRFMYLPSLGICFALGAAWERVSSMKRFKILAFILVAVVTGFLGVKTFQQTLVWRNSISLWQHQLKYVPVDPIALNNLAVALRTLSEYQMAEKEYQRIAKLQNEADINWESLKILESSSKVNYVIGLYSKAIEGRPDYLQAVYNLGELYHDLGDYKKAYEYYQKALAIDPKDKDTLYALGQLYGDVGESLKAVEVFDRLLSYYPDDRLLLMSVLGVYSKALKAVPSDQNYQKANQELVVRYTALIEKDKNKAGAYFNLGYLYSESGDEDRAISAYRMALDIEPNDARSLYNLANIYKNRGFFKDALDLYFKTIKAEPGNSDAYNNIGVIYNRLGNFVEAKNYYQKAIQKDPKNAKGYFNLGYIEETSGDKLKAVEFYKKTLEIDPHQVEASYNLGNVYAALGDVNLSISYYLRTTYSNPNHVDAWVNLSILSFQQKDYLAAIKYLDEAVLLGYEPPEEFAQALEEYRKR